MLRLTQLWVKPTSCWISRKAHLEAGVLPWMDAVAQSVKMRSGVRPGSDLRIN